MFAKLIVVAATLGFAAAHCPNSCNGHGSCGASGVCTCFDNWGMGGEMGGDCSDRMCPFELAWVDSPTSAGLVHQYAECAGKGVCDRESGECACLAGYTGKACARQVCPDDCSGHGTCEYMDELAFGTVFNDLPLAATDPVRLGVGAQRPTAVSAAWDSGRARACVCDAAWSGINCASKLCPRGNDYLSTRLNTGVAAVFQKQKITLVEASTLDNGIPTNPTAAKTAMHGSSFALTFTSRMNERFTTTPIVINSAWAGLDSVTTSLAYAVKHALQNLPNRVISEVNVVSASVDLNSVVDAALTIEVEFVGTATQGKQNLLEVSTTACTDGCTPYINGVKAITQWHATNPDTFTSGLAETVVADYNTYECGRRGKCDSDTGVCACFEGFTGEACSEITALV